jgi:hypothetical protein
MAQNVYSLNIVGYANVTNHLGYNFDTAPFRVTTAVTNGANEILPANTGQYDGDAVLVWTGTGWAANGLDSSSPTGFSDSGGNPSPAPILSSGQGFLYQDTIANGNLTFVGEVRTGTNNIALTTATYQAKGSPVPFAGDLITSLQWNNSTGAYDGDEVLILVNYGQGFAAYGFDSSSGTGFSDSGGNPIPGPQINVGQGFFYHNNGTGAHTWTQIFNP